MEEKQTFASTTHQEDVDEESLANQTLAASAQRKLDFRLMPILTLVYLFAFIDRSNAGNARVLGTHCSCVGSSTVDYTNNMFPPNLSH
jgi:hypothetical protein